jgi:predicted nucleic-acid-binding protein
MLSVDTNVIVRFLTADDAAQFRRAEALIANNEIKITTTVVLEAAWVLSSSYACSTADIVDGIEQLMRLPQVRLDNWEAVARAISWTRSGMGFGDALHLALSGDSDAFVTFDEGCLRVASRLGLAARAP